MKFFTYGEAMILLELLDKKIDELKEELSNYENVGSNSYFVRQGYEKDIEHYRGIALKISSFSPTIEQHYQQVAEMAFNRDQSKGLTDD